MRNRQTSPNAFERRIRDGAWVMGAENNLHARVKALVTERVGKGVAWMPFHFGGWLGGRRPVRGRYSARRRSHCAGLRIGPELARRNCRRLIECSRVQTLGSAPDARSSTGARQETSWLELSEQANARQQDRRRKKKSRLQVQAAQVVGGSDNAHDRAIARLDLRPAAANARGPRPENCGFAPWRCAPNMSRRHA
jgi:hypothetical protein